jgi:hypothetical protein
MPLDVNIPPKSPSWKRMQVLDFELNFRMACTEPRKVHLVETEASAKQYYLEWQIKTLNIAVKRIGSPNYN